MMVRKGLIQKGNPWKSEEAGKNPQNPISSFFKERFYRSRIPKDDSTRNHNYNKMIFVVLEKVIADLEQNT